MFPSRCTVLVLGATLGLGLAAVTRAGEPVEPAGQGRQPATPRLAEHGIASYQLIREDPGGGRLWWLFDAGGKPLGSLEHQPPADAPAPLTTADTYVLTFKEDVLVVQTAPARLVLQLNKELRAAFVYDEPSRRLVADPANGPGAVETLRPHVKRLGTLIEEVMAKDGPAAPPRTGGPAGPPRGTGAPVEPLEEEAPCSGSWHNRTSLGVLPTRSWACGYATDRVQAACADASTGACGSCCELTPDCDCACFPETDFFCFCSRDGKACAPGCPRESLPPYACRPAHCNIDCLQVARDRVSPGLRIVGGACNFGTACQCDAWVNTCNPSNNERSTFYSLVQSCDPPCPPGCEAASSPDSPSCNQCGSGTCEDPNPQCCFEAFCAPDNSDCCTDGGSCPSGWECCDDGTSSCCPNGYRCCWLEEGPMCCDWGPTSPDPTAAPRSTQPRLDGNQPAIPPKSPKE